MRRRLARGSPRRWKFEGSDHLGDDLVHAEVVSVDDEVGHGS